MGARPQVLVMIHVTHIRSDFPTHWRICIRTDLILVPDLAYKSGVNKYDFFHLSAVHVLHTSKCYMVLCGKWSLRARAQQCSMRHGSGML